MLSILSLEMYDEFRYIYLHYAYPSHATSRIRSSLLSIFQYDFDDQFHALTILFSDFTL